MKGTISSTVLLIFGVVASLAQAQNAPAPSPEQKKLGVFVGSWTGEGKMETTPFGKAGVTKSTMNCKWYSGGFHLICDAEDNGPTGKNLGHSIYGYDSDKKQYFTFGVESSGFAGPGEAKVEGSAWTFDGKTTMAGKPLWFRTAVKLASPTEMTWKSEYSEDGKTWKLQGEGKMTRKP
jgi:hypothetical protein